MKNKNTKLLIEAKNDMDKLQMRRKATRLTTFPGHCSILCVTLLFDIFLFAIVSSGFLLFFLERWCQFTSPAKIIFPAIHMLSKQSGSSAVS